MVEMFRMNFKNNENRSMMMAAIENHHWFLIKLWLNPYAERDKNRRITKRMKNLKDAPTSTTASFS
jgi:hypothetical protein